MTPEEIAAAETAAAKAKADAETARLAEEAKKKEDFETWLASQPKDVQEKYNAHVGGLKSALEKERAENQALKPKAKLADELTAAEQKKKDAELSDLEKEKKVRLALEEENKQLKLNQMRRDAAEKVKLPSEFADRLRGETPEELEADAQKLLKAIPTSVNLSATNASNSTGAVTDAQRKAFLNGGPLPGV